MYGKRQRPPIQSLLVRLGGVAGLIFGFSQGVVSPVEKAIDCSEGGMCVPTEETVGAADILVPMGFGVVGGVALGLLLAALAGRLMRSL